MTRRFKSPGFIIAAAVIAASAAMTVPGQCGEGPAATASGAAQSTAALTEQFPIVAGDMLAINVYKESALTGQFRVGETGKIIYPMIGEIQAQGLTLEAFRLTLTEALKKYIKDPLVRVDRSPDGESGDQLLNARSAVILGCIKNQGVQPLRAGGATLLQVVAQASGFTSAANPRLVRVVSLTDGKRTSRTYDLYDVLDGRSPDPEIQPGDTIFVPESIF